MTAEPHTQVLDLVEWVAHRQRPYAEVMAEWHAARGQTSPLVEAVGQSLIVCTHQKGSGWIVRATPLGRHLLKKEGRLEDDVAAPGSASNGVRQLH